MSTLTKVGAVVNKTPQRKNIIINGNMNIKQNPSGSAKPDKWYTRDGGISHELSRVSDSPDGSNYSFLMESDYTGSVNASTRFYMNHGIEGQDFAPLIVDQIGTLSFYVKSTETGIHCVALRNSIADRSYVVEYTVNQASTWERKEITIDFDYSGGTWDYADGLGLEIAFVTDCGTTYHTATPDTWVSADVYATANQTNHYEASDAKFYLTQVQLEIGDTATEYDHVGYQDELLTCFRYYQEMESGVGGTATAGGQYFYNWINFYCQMRATPSIGTGHVSTTNCGTQFKSTVFPTGVLVSVPSSAAGFTESVYRYRCWADVING